MLKALSYAFPKTIPVLTGYIFLATSYAIYGLAIGIPAWLLILMSVVIYGGSMQFAAVDLLSQAFNPLASASLTLMIHARHIFYAVTMLKPYSDMDWKGSYVAFALTDETFALNLSLDVPDDIDRDWVYFWTSLLNQSYWILGTIIGVLVGRTLTIDTTGIDFVLTALFVTNFTDRWLTSDDKRPALIGLSLSVIALLIFGPSRFMIPAMLGIILVFLVQYQLERRQAS